jgi:hypothetical protein
MRAGRRLIDKQLMKEVPSFFSERRRFLKSTNGGKLSIDLRDATKSKLSVDSLSAFL